MGMTLDNMHTHMTADPTTVLEHSLPGAHMPIKGFYFTRNLPVPTHKSSPKAPSKRLSSRFLSFKKPSHAVESLAQESPIAFADETEPDVNGLGRG